MQQYIADFPIVDLDEHFSFRDKVTYGGQERTVADAFKSVAPIIESLMRKTREDGEKNYVKLADLDALYTELLETIGSMYRNEYTSIFIDVIAANKNLADNLTPIGFDRFKGITSPGEGPASVFQVLASLFLKLSTDYATKEQVKKFTAGSGNMFTPSTQQIIHENTAKGATLTGVFANAAKALAMLLYNKNSLVAGAEYETYVNGNRFNGLSRTEHGSTVNIFHTIDTLINAAIDNVKEEILYHMNISAKNSNQFIASIGMGVPLNDIVKIFAHPLIIELGKFRSYELASSVDSKVLGSKIDLSKYTPQEGVIVNLDVEEVVKSIHSGETSAELAAALLTFYNVATNLGNTLYTTVNALSILTEPPTTEEGLHEVLDTWRKIVQIKVADTETPEETSHLEVDDLQEELDKLIDIRNAQKLADDSSEEASTARKEVAAKIDIISAQLEDSRTVNNMLERAAAKAQSSVQIANSLARKGHTGLNMRASAAWPFKENYLANIPHIRRILTSLLKIQSLLESLVWTSRQEFNFVAARLFKDLGMWSVSRFEAQEEIKHEFFKFLTSNMSFRLPNDNTVISTKIEAPENLEDLKTTFVDKNGRQVEGYKSPPSKWVEDFVNKIVELKVKYPDNLLLLSLEVNYKNGIMLAADKANNPVFLAELRQGFKELSSIRETGEPDRTKRRYSNLQADLFKYAIIKDGLGFSKTTLSFLFPEEFYVAYSREIESRLRSIFSQTYSKYGFAQANVIYDLFKFQYIRNNYSKLPYVHYHKRISYSHQDARGNFYDAVYKGTTPKFFTENSTVFMKVAEDDGKSYAVIVPTTSTPYYEFDYDVLEKGFNLATAIGADEGDNRVPIIYTPMLDTDTVTTNMDLPVGKLVMLGHKAATYPKFRRLARVVSNTIKETTSKKRVGDKSVTKKNIKHILTLESVGKIDTENPMTVRLASEAALVDTTPKSSIDMASHSLLKVAGSRNYLIMAPTTEPSNPYKGLKTDQELLEKSQTPYYGIKPIVLYGIPSEEAINNIDEFFKSIEKDSRTLVFDKDKLYSLSQKEGYKLSLEVVKYMFTKLREEKGYQSSNIDSEAFQPLQEDPDC